METKQVNLLIRSNEEFDLEIPSELQEYNLYINTVSNKDVEVKKDGNFRNTDYDHNPYS
jgi:hypothetical protein